MARLDPLRNFRFRLEIDNITQAGFSDVAIAETTIDAVDYREGTDPPHVRKLSGLTKYGNITLKWGLTVGGAALDLFKWHADVSAGLSKSDARRSRLLCRMRQEWMPLDSSFLKRGPLNTTPAISMPRATR